MIKPRLVSEGALALLVVVACPIAAIADSGHRTGDEILTAARARVEDISTDALAERIASDARLVVLDVRTAKEIQFLGGWIDAPRQINIPRGWIEFRIAEAIPDRSTPIVAYCGTNQRSPLVADTLQRMGYSEVLNYADGYFAWRDSGLPIDSPDRAPNSMLYAKPQKVIDGVFSAIGATAPPTYANSGHNNNLSFIVTDEGVVVVNAGDNDLLARALHEEIKAVTDQPVKYVILENGQGHAMLGSGYWKGQGATIIAHEDAARVIESKGEAVLERMRRGRRDKAMGTVLTLPDQTFSDEMLIELGGLRIELKHLGPSHSPGDIVVWLPQKRLLISGDLAFHQRLLPVFEYTDTGAWIETWDRLAALDAKIVIPGHGTPTGMEAVAKDTKGYLEYMRERIGEILDEGGELEQAYEIDQSPYAHLHTFKELAKLNAERIFRQMEFE